MFFSLAIGPPEILSIEFLFVVLVLLPAMALTSVFRNEFESNKRYIWAALIILIPVLGSIVYVVLGRPKRLRRAL